MGDRPLGRLLRFIHRAFGTAGPNHRGYQLWHLRGIWPRLVGDLAEQPAAALRHGVDQRQRQRAFAQVVAGWLAERGLVAGIIQHIVDNLESQARSYPNLPNVSIWLALPPATAMPALHAASNSAAVLLPIL